MVVSAVVMVKIHVWFVSGWVPLGKYISVVVWICIAESERSHQEPSLDFPSMDSLDFDSILAGSKQRKRSFSLSLSSPFLSVSLPHLVDFTSFLIGPSWDFFPSFCDSLTLPIFAVEMGRKEKKKEKEKK